MQTQYATTRSGKLFGDQYSNFNAGKLLLYIEGLAGLEDSVPDKRLVMHDTMSTNWEWMEVRLPIRMPSEKKTRWPVIRYERTEGESEIAKSIRVTDCPEPRILGMSLVRAASEATPHDLRFGAGTHPFGTETCRVSCRSRTNRTERLVRGCSQLVRSFLI